MWNWWKKFDPYTFDKRWGRIPSADNPGVSLDGEETTLGICNCGCGLHTAFLPNGESDHKQTLVLRILLDDQTGAGVIDMLVDTMKRAGKSHKKIIDKAFRMLPTLAILNSIADRLSQVPVKLTMDEALEELEMDASDFTHQQIQNGEAIEIIRRKLAEKYGVNQNYVRAVKKPSNRYPNRMFTDN